MDTLSNRPFNQRGWGRGLKKSAVLGTILALLLLLSGKGQIVHAASITVTTTDDELNADGDCSLREAIQAVESIAHYCATCRDVCQSRKDEEDKEMKK